MLRSISLLFCALVAVSAVLTGCGASKADQCNALIDVFNAHISAQNALGEAKSDDDLKKHAANLKKSSEAMAKVQLEDPKLKEFAEKFKKETTSLANSLQTAAELQGEPSPEAVAKLTTEMNTSSETLKGLNPQISEYCK